VVIVGRATALPGVVTQQSGLCGNHIEVRGDAADIAVVGNVERAARIGDRCLLTFRSLIQQRQTGQPILHLLNAPAPIRDNWLPTRHRRRGLAARLARLRPPLKIGCKRSPPSDQKALGALTSVAIVAAFPSATPTQSNMRIKRSRPKPTCAFSNAI